MLSIRKDISRLSSAWMERPLSGTLNKFLSSKLQGIDSLTPVTHLKKVSNPDGACTPSGDLKVKIPRGSSRQQLKETAFPRWEGSFFLFLIFSLSSLGKIMFLLVSPNLLQKVGHILTIGFVTRKSDLFMMLDFLVLPATNFSLVSNATVSYAGEPMGVTNWVRLSQAGVPVPCFNHSPTTTILVQLHTFPLANHTTCATPPYYFPYPNMICSPAHKGDANRPTGDTSFQGL